MKRFVCYALVLFLGATLAIAQDAASSKAAIKSEAAAKGLNVSDVDQAVRAFVRLAEKGVNEEQARTMVILAIRDGKSSGEVERVVSAFCETYEKSGHTQELSNLTEICLKARINTENCERVMKAAKYALEKDVSPKQIRILAEETVRNGIDNQGLEAAIRTVGDIVERGESPIEARLSVSRAALTGIKEGLKGEKLTNRIRDEVRLREQTRDRIRKMLTQSELTNKGQSEQYQQRREERTRTQVEPGQQKPQDGGVISTPSKPGTGGDKR